MEMSTNKTKVIRCHQFPDDGRSHRRCSFVNMQGSTIYHHTKYVRTPHTVLRGVFYTIKATEMQVYLEPITNPPLYRGGATKLGLA